MSTTARGYRYPASTDHDRLWEHFQNLASDIDADVTAQPRILARGKRVTDSSTTTTEVGVLRLDGIPVVSGQAYRVDLSPVSLDSSVVNDAVQARCRFAIGSTATTSSTQISQPLQAVVGSIAVVAWPGLWTINAPSTGLLSVLISVARQSGTGNARMLRGLGAGDMTLIVSNMGVDPGDTGVSI
jgi:hypothetical protein